MEGRREGQVSYAGRKTEKLYKERWRKKMKKEIGGGVD